MASQLKILNYISNPLDQFEISTLLSLDAPIFANMELSLTNIGFYLTVGAIIGFLFNQLATNYYQIVSNI
jgi:F-type H+-transporting ATPase subunit a